MALLLLEVLLLLTGMGWLPTTCMAVAVVKGLVRWWCVAGTALSPTACTMQVAGTEGTTLPPTLPTQPQLMGTGCWETVFTAAATPVVLLLAGMVLSLTVCMLLVLLARAPIPPGPTLTNLTTV
jgi:hypothetical protein